MLSILHHCYWTGNNSTNGLANSGLPITFTNTTENTIGSFSDFGIQYRWTFGDGTVTTVNSGSSNDGDTNRTISNTLA